MIHSLEEYFEAQTIGYHISAACKNKTTDLAIMLAPVKAKLDKEIGRWLESNPNIPVFRDLEEMFGIPKLSSSTPSSHDGHNTNPGPPREQKDQEGLV